MTVRVLIVDDEPLALEGLRMLVDGDPELEVLGTAVDGATAVAEIRARHPDLVLLDVQMPGMDGFDTLAALDPGDLPLVIFVTAYDRYALKAFDVHAVDYLLKPIREVRFRAAVARMKTLIAGARARASASEPSGRDIASERLLAVVSERRTGPSEHTTATAWLRRLAVKDGTRIVFVDVDEIDWISGADYYLELHVGSRSFLQRESLQRLQARLDPGRFVRVHRSAIVNLTQVREIRHRRRCVYVVLRSGTEIKVSSGQRHQLEGLLGLK
jgi:two-component system LytT family response regulator